MKLPALKEIIDERKEKAVETLSVSYANNRLPLEEYERLVEYINKIESERELVIVEKIVAEYKTDNAAEQDHTPEDAADYNAADDDTADYHPSYSQSNLFNNLSILSSRVLEGPIKSGSQYVSILGSQYIKIRKADLLRNQTFLDIVSILGEAVVYVEQGIRVNNRAVPILGGAWTNNKVNKSAAPGAKEVIISGAAVLGNITIKVLKD